MPATVTTEIEPITGIEIDASVQDRFTVAHDDTADYGRYRTEYREADATGAPWQTALAGRSAITDADSAIDWTSGSNASVGTTTTVSLDGTAIEGTTDDASTGTNRWIGFTPPAAGDAADVIQFWYHTSHTAGTHKLQLFDTTGATERVDFSDQVDAAETPLTIQIDVSDYTSVDTSAITDYRWVFDGPSGVAKTIRVDGVLTGMATRDESDPDITIPNLADGQQYDIRIRAETEHGKGEWAMASGATSIPRPTNVTVSNVGMTSATITWTDNSNNETGQAIIRSRVIDGEQIGFREVVDVEKNVEQARDTTALPGKTYAYGVRTKTQFTYSDSGTVRATTTDSGLEDQRTGSSGWRVEVDHPEGRTVTPQPAGDPTWRPKQNDYPEVEIPVSKSEVWDREAWTDATMRVWRDGVRLAIGELRDVTQTPERTVLTGVGGVGLRTDVTAEFESAEANPEVESLIDSNTPYAPHVDSPDAATLRDVPIQSIDSLSEWQDALVTPVSSSTPYYLHEFGDSDGFLFARRTCYTMEGEAYDSGGVGALYSDEYSNGVAARFSAAGQTATWKFTPEYDIPESAVALFIRLYGSNTPRLDATLNGSTWTLAAEGTTTVQYTWPMDQSIDQGVAESEKPEWRDAVASPWSGASTTYAGGTLAKDTEYSLTIEAVSASGTDPDAGVDVIAPADGRYEYDLPSVLNEPGGYLDGPGYYPKDGITVQLASVDTVYTVESGDAFGSASSFDEPYDDVAVIEGAGDAIHGEITLGGFGETRDATPREDYRPQGTESFKMTADLSDTPLLVNKAYDGELMTVLQTIADETGCVFEVRRDESTSSGIAIEWTREGQRTGEMTPEFSDYELTKEGDPAEKVVVKGSGIDIKDEAFTAALDTWHDLAEDSLQTGSDRVVDASDGTVYVRGSNADYDIDHTGGRIKPLSSGSIADGASLTADYTYHPEGSYTVPTATSDPEPRTVTTTVPDVTTDTAAEQAARRIAEAISEPRYGLKLDLESIPPSWSTVESIDLSETAIDAPVDLFQLRGIDANPGGDSARFGTRETLEDIRDRISEQLEGTQQRV